MKAFKHNYNKLAWSDKNSLSPDTRSVCPVVWEGVAVRLLPIPI